MRYADGITTREESYWYGFLIGDGNLSRHRNRITVVLQERDLYHLHKCKKFFGGGYIRRFSRAYPEYYQFTIEIKEQTEALRRIGLRPCKSRTIHWEDIPSTYTFDFLRGLFDADGTIYINPPTTIIRWNGTKSIVQGIRDIIEIRQIFSMLPNVVKDRESYSLSFNGRWKAEELGNHLWYEPTVVLNRKYNLFLKLKEYNRRHPRLRSKLSEEDVGRIKYLREKGHKLREIGELYDVSPSMISRIVNGQRYQVYL